MNRMTKLLTTTVMATACAFGGGSAALATPADSSGTNDPAVAQQSWSPAKADHHFSVKCKGGKANFSWSDGSVNTRIYYNNHCSKAAKVGVQITDASGTSMQCLKAPAGKKSSKQFQVGLTGKVDKLRKGC